MTEQFHYGGQALIEGVMIRGQRGVTLAVRCPDGTITQASLPLSSFYAGRLRRLPLSRGIVVLAETLTLGMRALMYSARVSLGEDEIPKGAMGGTVAFALLFAVALFFALPYFLSRLLGVHASGSFLSSLAEGGIRLGVFLAYLKLVGMWSQVARVFAYHGAEHKVVNALEAGVPLEPRAVKGFSTAHLRCGTAFLLLVLVIAIPIFALIGSPSPYLALPLRLLFLPVIAALSYEIIRLGAHHPSFPPLRLLLAPGLLLQRLTTREPDEAQIEVALTALQGALAADGEKGPRSPSPSPIKGEGDAPLPPLAGGI